MDRFPSRFAAALLAVSLVVSRGAATENAPDLRENATVKAVKKVKPSVVAIKVTMPASSGRTRDMTGSGLIVDQRGYIVTNRHVIAGSTRTVVCLLDGTEFTAQVVLADPETDLAILRVNTKRELPAQPLAPSTNLYDGEDVIAIGHPLGYHYTVSKGIVSAQGRKINMPNGYTLTGLIQTSANINPGNSGGPLVNINGGVIGINVALREDAQGIAFAISSETVKRVLKTHLASLKVSGADIALQDNKQPPAGKTGSAQAAVAEADRIVAAGANLQPGDMIVSVGAGEVRVLREGRELTIALPLVRGGHSELTAIAPRSGSR
ncbi:MAG TPA: trypsin-like peptidase domain-containing protein [Gemmataceae bacterium]|nr:trypsin-like peptidase domain-containing protein [Gemmataceae bacterium]